MPGIHMDGIEYVLYVSRRLRYLTTAASMFRERVPVILKGGGPLRVVDLVHDVLRSDTFSHLEPRGKA